MTNEELLKVKVLGVPPGAIVDVVLAWIDRLDSGYFSIQQFATEMKWLSKNVSQEEKISFSEDDRIKQRLKKHECKGRDLLSQVSMREMGEERLLFGPFFMVESDIYEKYGVEF